MMLEHCVVINLVRRRDRLEAVTEQLDRVGIVNWIRFDADAVNRRVDPSMADIVIAGSKVRCPVNAPYFFAVLCLTLSHRGVIELARDKGWSQVLVLEDDAVFHPRFNELWDQSLEYLPLDWRLLRLGTHSPKQEQVSGPWHRVTEGQVWYSHGYIARASVYDELIERFDGRLPTDLAWSRSRSEWGTDYDEIEGAYHHIPFLIGQARGYSDVLQMTPYYGIMRDMEEWS